MYMNYGDPFRIFDIKDAADFEAMTFESFNFQYANNPIYREFCEHLKKKPNNIDSIYEIPFLPISFFKTHKVVATDKQKIMFESSGTTGTTSKHYVADKSLYDRSFSEAFNIFYGSPEELCILAFLPSYLERKGSSLIYMVDALIKKSKHPYSGFYLNEFDTLAQKLISLEKQKTKTLLLGVSFALLDFIEKINIRLRHCLVMETGGMKGRRKEIIREDLHARLKKGFGVDAIHSEYGMTELLSQAYSNGNGIFKTPPWMKIIISDPEDPLQILGTNKTGGINIIDLANWYSCPFIATQDLGKSSNDGSFEILGRFDQSDVRGCNLMVL